MAKILIIEDEINIAKLMEDTLRLGNHETEIVSNGKQGLEKMNCHYYDLILLDVMLPGMDGFEILEKRKNKEVPIIFLSAKNDVASVVKGLKNGGADYMTKPFEPLELLARVELRLAKEEKEEVIYYKNIEIHPAERKVYQEGNVVELAPKEFDLLLLLIQNEGKALTRDKILNAVWNIDADIETRTVDYHIQQLRKKLGLKEDITTINKIGYCLEKRK